MISSPLKIPKCFVQEYFDLYDTLPDLWIPALKTSLAVDPELKMQVIASTFPGKRVFYIISGEGSLLMNMFSVTFEKNGVDRRIDGIPMTNQLESLHNTLLTIRAITEDITRFILNINSILEGEYILMESKEWQKLCDGDLSGVENFISRMKSLGLSPKSFETVLTRFAPVIHQLQLRGKRCRL